jgi:hypothetical protein
MAVMDYEGIAICQDQLYIRVVRWYRAHSGRSGVNSKRYFLP